MLADFFGIFIGRQDLPRTGRIQPCFLCQTGQSLVRRRILTISEISLEQRMFQLHLTAFQFGPMQKPVRIERVIDAAALVRPENKADLCTSHTQRFGVLFILFGRQIIFLHQVLADVLPLGRHLRVELERLDMHFGRHLPAQSGQCIFQGFQPDRAPRARYIGNKIYPDSGIHVSPPYLMRGRSLHLFLYSNLR